MMDDATGLNANGLNPDEQAVFDNLYGTNPGTAEAPKPGFFTRAWAGAGGVPSGLANTGLTIYDATNNLARTAVDKATYAWQDVTGAHDFSGLAGLPEGYGMGTPFKAVEGTSATDVREAVDTAARNTSADVAQWRENVNDFYRPDPATTGTAGNILFGAVEPITRIGVGSILTGGVGGLELAAGSMGYERTQELLAQGVNHATAVTSGAITAGTFEAMGAFGGEGGTLAQRVLKSAAINTGAGLVNRSLDSAVLNAAGYNKLAQQQQWNDAQAVISDAVIGAAFPLVHAGIGKLADASAARSENKLADTITGNPELFDALRQPDGNVSQFNIEAALTSLNAQHANEVAPGIPIDPASQGLHLKALDAAIQQTMRGEPVNVEPLVRSMKTIPRDPGALSAPSEGLSMPLGFSDVGRIIDDRLASLDHIAQGVLPEDQVRGMAKDAGELEDIIRGEYAARDSDVLRAPENVPTADQMDYATQTLAGIKQQLEQHRYAQNAAKQAENIRHKLANIDDDQSLFNLVKGWLPDASVKAAQARSEGVGEALHEAGLDHDMPNFGMPDPARTLPAGDPLLTSHWHDNDPALQDNTPERVAMRQSLVDERFAGKESVPEDTQPVAIVMGGGGASGKGTVLKMLRRMGMIPKGAVELDPDSFKTGQTDKEGNILLHGIPEYHQIVGAGDSRAAAVTHDESSMLYKQALARGMQGRFNMVLDRTMSKGAKGKAELQALRDAGYKVHFVGVSVDAGEALRRAVKRAMGKEKRYVPLGTLLEAHKGFSAAHADYVPLSDTFQLFDNNVPWGEDPVLMAHSANGEPLAITDPTRYNRFVEKVSLNEHATTHRELGETAAETAAGARVLQDRQVPTGRVEASAGGTGERPTPASPVHPAEPRGPDGETPETLNPAAGGVSASGPDASIRSSDAAYGTPARHPWVELDDSHNIPYAGGVNAAGDKVYVSQYMPDTVEAGGKTIDAKEGVFVHEVEEQKVMLPDGPKSAAYMTALREDIASEAKANPDSPKIPASDLEKVARGEPLDYAPAHNIATIRENAFIRQKYGIDPRLYQKALGDGIETARKKAAEEGDVPTDLDPTPYEDSGEAKLLDQPSESATDRPIEEVPLDQLTLSDDVPQFKGGANEQGVVEQLGGKFDRRGTGPIQVWRRADGKLEVISGRHRLDLARRSGEKTIPAQIYNEADGFTKDMAASLDAELNIRDGQGKVADYVQYFQRAAFDGPDGRAEADARGLLARATGKRAWTIARSGTPELIAAHRAGRIGDEAAVQIAQAAPGDARLQALGMKLTQEGRSITQAVNTMHAVRSMGGDRAATGDMFGFDDSAIKNAESMAKVAAAHQRALSERLATITGAARRPELAKTEGIDVRNPEVSAARVGALRAEREAWENWATDPAKVAQVRREAGLQDSAPDKTSGAPSVTEGLDKARAGEVTDADRIAATRPDLKLDDGTTAADAVRAADAEVAQAKQKADGIAAAVSCFLNFGSEV